MSSNYFCATPDGFRWLAQIVFILLFFLMFVFLSLSRWCSFACFEKWNQQSGVYKCFVLKIFASRNQTLSIGFEKPLTSQDYRFIIQTFAQKLWLLWFSDLDHPPEHYHRPPMTTPTSKDRIMSHTRPINTIQDRAEEPKVLTCAEHDPIECSPHPTQKTQRKDPAPGTGRPQRSPVHVLRGRNYTTSGRWF